MNKIKLNKKSLENVKISFDGQEIEVVPYISSENQETLIKVYFTAYFSDGKEDRLSAERINRMAVLDLLTNVDIDIDGKELTDMLDNVLASGLWEKIEKAIKNYRAFEHNLSIAIESKRKENSDIGYILRNFLDEKVSPLIAKFSEMDFSDEKLAEVKGLVGEIGKQLNPDTPVGSLIGKGVV